MAAPTTTAGKVGRWALNIYAALGFIYLFAPIFVIVLFSFNKPAGEFNIVWKEFTLDNWKEPFAEKELTDALIVSLKVALVSTVIATVLGSLIAIALSRYTFSGRAGIDLLLILPLTAPEIVMGSSLSTLFFGRNASFGFWTVVIAHVMFQVAFVALTVRARIRGFDWTLEQAAQDLGASPLRTFWKITFPLILPGILAGALLAFALVARRLHHHVLQRRLAAHVPAADLRRVPRQAPAPDQRAGHHDPGDEHRPHGGGSRPRRPPPAPLQLAEPVCPGRRPGR